jgi:hypothetical protein
VHAYGRALRGWMIDRCVSDRLRARLSGGVSGFPLASPEGGCLASPWELAGIRAQSVGAFVPGTMGACKPMGVCEPSAKAREPPPRLTIVPGYPAPEQGLGQDSASRTG